MSRMRAQAMSASGETAYRALRVSRVTRRGGVEEARRGGRPASGRARCGRRRRRSRPNSSGSFRAVTEDDQVVVLHVAGFGVALSGYALVLVENTSRTLLGLPLLQ